MEVLDLRVWPEFVIAGGSLHDVSAIDEVVIDSRCVASSRSLFIALEGESCDGHDFVAHAAVMGARYALVKKEYHGTDDITLLRVDSPLKALQEIATIYRKMMPAKVVAVTGSRGKTLVKDLLVGLLSYGNSVASSPDSFNSRIGVPLSVFEIEKHHDIAIIEAGISQAGEMDVLASIICPDSAVLTTIAEEHIVSLRTLDIIAAEKMKLLASVPSTGWVMLPDHDILKPFYSTVDAEYFIWNVDDSRFPLIHTGDTGPVVPYNIVFPDSGIFHGKITRYFKYFTDIVNPAIRAAWLLGATCDEISIVMREYSPKLLQVEMWKLPSGASIISEPYCSHSLSTKLAIEHFENTPEMGKKIFVFGGKGQSAAKHIYVKNIATQANVDKLVMVGDRTDDRHSNAIDIRYCSTEREALDVAMKNLKHDDTVLIVGHDHRECEKFRSTNKLVVNLRRVKDNIDIIRAKLPENTRIMAMVKAMGYGTDNTMVARFLQKNGVDIFGVAHVEEGVLLRHGGITADIFAVDVPIYDAEKLVSWGFEGAVSDMETVDALCEEALRQNTTVPIHLHVDTGMSRFGCPPEDALEIAYRISSTKGLSLRGIMTHFATADDPEQDAFTETQIDVFSNVITRCEARGIRPDRYHASNTSAALRFDIPGCSMARIGLGMFGINPSEACRGQAALRPALSLTSRIVQIKTCRRGDTVSYGRTYEVNREQERIAVIPLGYFDGLHRRYSGKGYVVIRGCRAPLVGNICMDFMMVDVTDIPNASIGDSVLVFGEDEYGHCLPPEKFAEAGGAIVYELITCLGPRIQRVFTYS